MIAPQTWENWYVCCYRLANITKLDSLPNVVKYCWPLLHKCFADWIGFLIVHDLGAARLTFWMKACSANHLFGLPKWQVCAALVQLLEVQPSALQVYSMSPIASSKFYKLNIHGCAVRRCVCSFTRNTSWIQVFQILGLLPCVFLYVYILYQTCLVLYPCICWFGWGCLEGGHSHTWGVSLTICYKPIKTLTGMWLWSPVNFGRLSPH